MEQYAVADRFPGASPLEVFEEWDEEWVKDVIQLISAENRYQLRHKGRTGGIDARTGIPLE